MIIASVQENQCYLAELLENSSGLYTICEKWKLPNEININKFKECFLRIIKMSEKLKREFYFDDDSILCCRKTKDERLTDDFIWNIYEIDFDMLQGPLIRGGIYACDKQNIFKLQFHHTLMDAWSLGFFIRLVAKVCSA